MCTPCGVCHGRPAAVDQQNEADSACRRRRPDRGGGPRRARAFAEDFRMLDVYIGNLNHSSWLPRAWLLMKHFRIPFREHRVSRPGATTTRRSRCWSATPACPACTTAASMSGRASPAPNTSPSATWKCGRPIAWREPARAASAPKSTPASSPCARRCR